MWAVAEGHPCSHRCRPPSKQDLVLPRRPARLDHPRAAGGIYPCAITVRDSGAAHSDTPTRDAWQSALPDPSWCAAAADPIALLHRYPFSEAGTGSFGRGRAKFAVSTAVTEHDAGAAAPYARAAYAARTGSCPAACTPPAPWPRATAVGRHRRGVRQMGSAAHQDQHWAMSFVPLYLLGS